MQKYKKRADGRYLTQVQIGYQDNGRPKYKNIYARTVRELEEKVIEFKSLLHKGIIVDDKNLTLGEWSKTWLKKYRSHVTNRTLQKDKGVVERHISSLHYIKLKNLKPHLLQELMNKKAEEGLTGHLKYIYITLKAILQQAVANEYIFKNPMENVTYAKYTPKKRRALYDYERTALEKANLTTRERAFSSLCLYAGARRGEALALMINDIDFKENTITINKTIVYDTHMPAIKHGNKDTSGNSEFRERIVPLVEPLRSHLIEHIKTLKGLYLFSSRYNELTTRTSYDHMWEMILKKMNATLSKNENLKPISEITAHYLRHTCATDLYYAGVDIKTCQYILGHKSIKITMDVYAHLENRNEDVKSKIENYLNKKITEQPKTVIAN